MAVPFGLLHFPFTTEGQQEQILNAVKEYLQYAVPDGWQVITAKHLRINVENIETLVQIVPNRIAWRRSAKGQQRAEHEINVILTGRIETDFAVSLLGEWARLFLDSGGPFDDIPCMGAETLTEAEAGYDADALTDTPRRYYGGLRLTFWGD